MFIVKQEFLCKFNACVIFNDKITISKCNFSCLIKRKIYADILGSLKFNLVSS